ncbi:histidinol dehydrogenase [Candidatus Bathyarchaeota archaeon]|nr:histidinol dehydrogenase [Candidatus Bathyarchaeota archaeon]
MIKRYTEEPSEILANRWPNISIESNELARYTSRILEDIKSRGLDAVLEYTEKFDEINLEPENIQVNEEEIKRAYEKTTDEQVMAIKESQKRLEKVESLRLEQQNFNMNLKGVEIRCSTRPLSVVGCYVPGGKALYPSTLVMNVTPAKVAGVDEVIVCTPPGKDRKVAPIILVAADICEVDKIYKLGGIQAIASMAYGIKPIKKVDKIVGPGNRYVTEAKRQVSDIVAIDKPAGPSEILIIADETADPVLVSKDLISQAEHGQGGLSGLVTVSESLANQVAKEIERNLENVYNKSTVKSVLDEGGFIYTVDNLDTAIKFANEFAPEHLEIIIKKPENILDKIRNAGLVLLGSYTPVSSTDYCMGVNHILPTEGYAKISSGLSVLDFVKPISIIRAEEQGLREIEGHIRALAEAEGLRNHYLALEARLK